jgi:hypothetical protein
MKGHLIPEVKDACVEFRVINHSASSSWLLIILFAVARSRWRSDRIRQLTRHQFPHRRIHTSLNNATIVMSVRSSVLTRSEILWLNSQVPVHHTSL